MASTGRRNSLGRQQKRQRSLPACVSEDNLLPLVKRRRPNNDQQLSKKNKSFKRSVRFSTAEQQVLFEVSPEEKQQAWYKRSDYQDFKEDMRTTALSVHLGITYLIEPDDFCLRGLESSLSPREGLIRKLRRKLLIETIIEEQGSQKVNNGRVCSVMICELSKALSAEALEDAMKRASQDATSR